MLALLAIKYFPIISYFLLFDDPLKYKNKEFLGFYFFCEFSTQFPNLLSKASSFCSVKVLSQVDSKFVDHLNGVKNVLFNLCGQLFKNKFYTLF
jgi:hypothetical protein